MNRYPEMKDSGVSWIGEIPKEWKIEKTRRNFTFRKGLSITKANLEESGVPVISYGQIHSKSNTGTGLNKNLIRYVNNSYIITNRDSIVEKSDFIFADTSEDEEGCGNCVYIDSNEVIFAGYHSIIAHPTSFESGKYLAYLFQTPAWRYQIRSKVDGVKVYSITQKILKETSILLPTPAEQDQIVRFLDWKASCINRLIALRRKQIERLEELKKALVSRAVTRGLDPRAPMKDSGVPWIGEMPEHWPLERGKNLYEKMQRSVRAEDEVVTCFRDGTVTLRKNRRTTGFTESLKEIGYQGIKKGDLVIHVMDAFAGSVGVSDSDGKGTPVYSVCQAKADINNYYFAFLLREMARTGYIQSLYRGIRERSSDFRFEVFAAQFYPVPPLAEQDQIVAYLDARTAKIDAAVGAKERQIEKLRELKTRLISDAVTGKIDVRGVSVPDGVYAWEDAEEPGGAEDEDLSEEADGDERS